MAKFRRSGYVFITWKGDHDPRHVHVFKAGREILKWNLEASVAMNGQITRKILEVITQLVKEGKL